MTEALRVLSGLTADQWGLVTTTQANAIGVGNATLNRMVAANLLDRVTRGVYSVTTAVPDPLWRHKAAWLLLEPAAPAWKREPLGRNGGVVSHVSATVVLGLGDLGEEHVELSVPRRRTTRNPGVRFRIRELAPHEVTEVGGLPVTGVERTVADLLDDGVDGGHVADVAAQALRRGMADRDGLARSLGGRARSLGARGQGHDAELAALDLLLAQATIRPDVEVTPEMMNVLFKSFRLHRSAPG
ncbi:MULTISPECIES: type IV toxin-antitoxin system AbiEi family antitoxin domain-containing protein [Actinosynnema]|uniref:type IV toxin-antitoxin system AbiEi family antitoxin domain-containing protein n=1 Tax=Actinosynnema TaxID=40566 RepID=UPI0020A5B7A1|nr:type IV toxin-antitoxin system AbiEi family antitoxin domain-containing protein [Actinosynnema pretiosum]MCP2095995.1 Transcriptional regulator, AbiEi antitoxin, Type IV TA system [Actinosynnema pretiosum]